MDTKSIFLSKTFWGTALTVIAMLAPKVVHMDSQNADVVAQQIVVLIGAALAIYGRVKANTKVTVTGK